LLRTIPVFHSFARSGGTLVNQLLGVHPQCLVLSEVNPAASFKPVAEQAHEWLGLVPAHEVPAFAGRPYREQIAILDERAAAAGKRLIVRDWVTVNFLPGAAREHTVPSGLLEQELYLERAALRPVPLVVARRSAAVYRSIRDSFAHLHDLAVELFAASYLRYARSVAAFPRVHLEKLRAKPSESLGEILRVFGLDDSGRETLLQSFHGYRRCTGNVTLQGQSESAAATRILPPEAAARGDARDPTHPAMAEADGILGYD
jgi:hypothetical protein